MLASLLSAVSFSPAPEQPVVLVTFDGSGTDRQWHKTDDPVMGGKSKSTFTVQDGAAMFAGTCAIVPSLKAPGFCNVGTDHSLLRPAKFADASAFIDGTAFNVESACAPGGPCYLHGASIVKVTT